MESTENRQMPNSPKPTDEAQLPIETVTPDTEKGVVPTKEANHLDGKKPKSGTVTPPEINEVNEAKGGADDSKEGGKDPIDNPTHKKAEESGDARDEVETVSP